MLGCFNTKLKSLEDIQVELYCTKPINIQTFVEQETRWKEKIENIKNNKFSEETKRIDELAQNIEHDELSLDILIQDNIELAEETRKISEDIKGYEKKLQEIHEDFNEEYQKIDTLYHEQILKNIERRNYLQKLRILMLENRKRKSRGTKDW